MMKILKNKKGFTLVELIATIAIMAIIAGIAVPSVYATTARKQKSTAETDLQQMYRNCISCITDLAQRYITPDSPFSRFETYPDDIKDEDGNYKDDYLGYEKMKNVEGTVNNGWYIEFEKQLVKKIYATVTALDIDVYYYYPQLTTNAGDTSSTVKSNDFSWLKVPNGCSASDRSTFVTAGNKNPYIVVQVVKICEADVTKYNNFVIISYHNDKNPFKYHNQIAVGTSSSNGVDTNVPLLTGFGDDGKGYNTYKTNGGNDIIYSYRIR